MKRDGIFSRESATPLDRLLSYWRMRTALRYLSTAETICDLGCGREGAFLHRISKGVKRGIGFDQEVVPGEGNIQLHKGDLNKAIPLPDNSVNAVTSLALIEHLENPQLHVSEAYRILVTGGIFVLTTPTNAAKPVWEFLISVGLIKVNDSDDHKEYFNKDKLWRLFLNAGFQDIKYQLFEFGFNQVISAKK